ncbi:ribonuclease PH [bacterium]|nr:ribonuclease PH [bacterium]
MTRKDGRQNNKIRPLKVTEKYVRYAEGSILIEAGSTRIICNASVVEKVPPHLKGCGTGWVTAEYALLPRATISRKERERFKVSGRTYEIQRLIGRALRAVIDLKKLGERTILVDCDVIQADGGTRTTAINGAFIAVVLALKKLKKEGKIKEWPVKDFLAATSVGKINDRLLLDLCYEEDYKASVDINIAMTDSGQYVEIQGAGEEAYFSEEELYKALKLAKIGIKEIIKIQKELLPSSKEKNK